MHSKNRKRINEKWINTIENKITHKHLKWKFIKSSSSVIIHVHEWRQNKKLIKIINTY